jgi:CRP-like cAMP-binding protein
MESVSHPSCLSCELRPNRLFCDLPADALQSFDSIKSVAAYPRGASLFNEGRQPKGIYVLCDGRAKLSISSENGKRLMLRVAGRRSSPSSLIAASAVRSRIRQAIRWPV